MDFSALHDLAYSTQFEKRLQYLAGLGLSVENEHLIAAALVEGEPERVHNDCLDTFLGIWDWTPSTKERLSPREYDQPEKALPELPVEVWNIIIDLATYVPGACDVHDYSAIAAFTFDSRGIYARSRFEAVMRDKLALSLVCRRLNAITHQFLFEYLRISSGEQASVIAQVLKHRQDMGVQTRRVELALEGSHGWIKEHTRAMICIFQSCPNLVCFSTAFCDPEPWVYSLPSLIEALAQHKNFKRIEVKGGKDILESIAIFLQDLEVLWCLPTGHFLPLTMNDRCSLPQLRALVISGIYIVDAWKLETPKLRACITQEGINEAMVKVPPREQIEYLSMRGPWMVISDLSVWRGLQTLSVKYLELATRRLDWPKAVQHPTLQCIIIEEVANDFLEEISGRHLEENLQRIVSPDIFPHLQCVRIHLSFMMERISEFELSIRFEWLRSCVRHGLRIEMLQGSMERSGNEWKILSHDRLNDVLSPPGFTTVDNIMEYLGNCELET